MHLRLRTWKMWEYFFFTSCINCVPTKISTRTDKDGFSPAVFSSRLEQSAPVTEWLVNCLRVLFSTAKSMVIMGSCVRFCLHNMLFLISLVNAPEFRCCRVISLANQKLTFDEIIICTTRHDVIGQFHCKLLLSSEIVKAEAVVVEPVKRKTSEFIVIWFKLISNRDFNTEKPSLV